MIIIKLIIDFLCSQKDAILNDPIPFIIHLLIGTVLGCVIAFWILKQIIETNEERLKTNEERLKLAEAQTKIKEEIIKEKDAQIQILEQKLVSQGELNIKALLSEIDCGEVKNRSASKSVVQ